MISDPSRLLTSGRPLAGLLTEGKEFRLRRLVDSLWKELRQVRLTKSPSALYRSLQLIKEINTLGFAAVVINKGKVVGAKDPRFPEELLVEDPKPPESLDLRWKASQQITSRLRSFGESQARLLLLEEMKRRGL